MATKKSGRKTVKKVPKVEPKVKVIHLHCPNCGEEDEKVIYCSQCDSPMDVVKVEDREEDEVIVDAAVSKDEAGEASEDEVVGAPAPEEAGESLDDPEAEKIVAGGFSLGDIYSDGDEVGLSTGSAASDDDSDVSLDDVMNALDE